MALFELPLPPSLSRISRAKRKGRKEKGILGDDLLYVYRMLFVRD